MSILTENLRHFYQRRGLWLVYVWLGFFVWISVYIPLESPEAGMGKFIGLVVFEFLVGLLAAVMQMEIMTKPFAFCLPGHRQMVRKFLFVVAVATNSLGSLLFVFYPDLPLTALAWVMCSAFFAGVIFYLAGVWLAIGTKQPMALVGFMIAAIFFGKQLNLHRQLEDVIVGSPGPVIVLGLLCSVVMWLRLGAPNLARRNCLRPWIGFESFNYEKVRDTRTRFKADRWRRLKDHPRPWVESLFLNRMEASRSLSVARYAWGSLYVSFGLVLSRWPNVLLFALFLAFFLGYTGPRMWGIVVFVPLILVSNAKPVVFSSMLTTGGRNERFYSALTVALVSAALLALFVGAVIAVSALLATFLPDVSYGGHSLLYQTVTVKCLYAPLIFLPIVATVHLTLHRRPVLMIVASMVIVYVIVMGGFMSRAGLPVVHSFQAAGAIGVAAWIVFVLVLRRISTRHCLVK